MIGIILVQSLILVFLATSGLANSFLQWKGKTILKAKSLRQFSQVQREDNSEICADKTLTLVLFLSWFQLSAIFHRQNYIFIILNIVLINNDTTIVYFEEKICN